MATLLVDSPPAPAEGQATPESPDGAPPAPAAGAAPPQEAPERTCATCDAPMAAGQDWCLQCGAGVRGSIGAPSWRSAATIIGATALLALVAAAAAVAALSQSKPKPHTVTATIARVTPPVGAPATPGGAAATPAPAKGLGALPKLKSALPFAAVKPPKIPLTATTPKSTTPTTSSGAGEAGTSTPTTSTPTSTETGGSSPSGEGKPAAILLDTNAASTYNPYGYPATNFGDPSLTIDGDPTTGWTAQVNPATAPQMANGVLIDLKASQKVASVHLINSTPGMTVQMYGTRGRTVPVSITDPAWTPLSPSEVIKKKNATIKLRDTNKKFTYLTLWISAVPASSVGTAAAPGHVSVNELELFPAS